VHWESEAALKPPHRDGVRPQIPLKPLWSPVSRMEPALRFSRPVELLRCCSEASIAALLLLGRVELCMAPDELTAVVFHLRDRILSV
jgi:hypothetical protein